MSKIRIFISSVQSEFAKERKLLADYIRTDVLLGKFFSPFIFEELPAINKSAQDTYLYEVENCNIYLCICGEKYGNEDAEGVSPTEREFETACAAHRHRLVFVKRAEEREAKEQAFIKRVEQKVVRKSFETYDELRNAVYAALVHYMEEKELLRLLPWDAAYNPMATMDDIDPEKVSAFVDLAKEKRRFKKRFSLENIPSILRHLDLLSKDGRLTNSAVLLFAKNPQRFFPTSEVKCMVFPTNVKRKPVLSYQIYKGNVFELVDEAVGFVMQHIDVAVGTHEDIDADVKYEIPMSAVTELIVNAVAHRSYESNGSVEVMLYPDRLEVWNPGQLPYGLTTAMLREEHNSMPTNPTLATPMYLAGYIERMGSGTTDVVNDCVEAGLREPEFEQTENFRATIWRRNVGQKGNGNVAQNVTQRDEAEAALNQGIARDVVAGNVTQNVGQNVTQTDRNVTQKGDRNVTQTKAQQRKGERYILVMNTLLTNRRTPLYAIAAKLGVTRRTIIRDMNAMRMTYRIEWIGGSRKGRWEIERL